MVTYEPETRIDIEELYNERIAAFNVALNERIEQKFYNRYTIIENNRLRLQNLYLNSDIELMKEKINDFDIENTEKKIKELKERINQLKLNQKKKTGRKKKEYYKNCFSWWNAQSSQNKVKYCNEIFQNNYNWIQIKEKISNDEIKIIYKNIVLDNQ